MERVTATIPAHTAGTVDVTVTTPGGTSPTSAADQYTYFARPTVTAVSPGSGPSAGGTPVTVNGTGLTGTTALTFGAGSPATAVSCTDTTCTATSPAHAAGTVDIQATTPGGTGATSGGDRFTFIPPTADIAVTVTGQPHLGILVPYLTYTLTTHNNGPDAATSATITASLPPGTSTTNLSSGCTTASHTVTCAYGSITNGASSAKSFRVPLSILSLRPVTVTGLRTAREALTAAVDVSGPASRGRLATGGRTSSGIVEIVPARNSRSPRAVRVSRASRRGRKRRSRPAGADPDSVSEQRAPSDASGAGPPGTSGWRDRLTPARWSALVLVALAVVLIAENTHRVKIRLLVPLVTMPLYEALLIMFLLGLLSGGLLAYNRNRNRRKRARTNRNG